MNIDQYEAIQQQINVLTWPEASPEELSDFIGADNVNVIPGGIQICNSRGEWVTLGTGWAVSAIDGKEITVMTPDVLATKYRKIS